MVLKSTVGGGCPGGFCDYLVQFSEVLVVLLLADGFIFLVTLIPPLFSWKNKKPDSRKRIFFAAFACLTFYFWLVVLALHSLYCFGFLAHAGPCNSSEEGLTNQEVVGEGLLEGFLPALPNQTITNLTGVVREQQEQCVTNSENSLKNITLVNFLILLIIIIVIAANINEVLHAKALYYQETLCRKEDIQRFLSSLVTKRPEVGHLVKCFHISKSADAKTNSGHRVVTYSTVDNFTYNTWKDFSDLRLIEPSREYPVIEVEIVLNFFPGDHATADKYKQFVQKLTKENSGKDSKISIDDYFHIEDQKEWTFYIGARKHISPWWEKDPARIFLSCIFMVGWPFRLSYRGKVAKHRIEVKKAVFCEATAQDEGVSLTQGTPGSSLDGCNSTKQEIITDKYDQMDGVPSTQNTPVHLPNTELGDMRAKVENGSNHNNETVVDVQVAASSPPPQYQQHNNNPSISSGERGENSARSPDRSTPLLNQRHGASNMVNMGVPPRRAEPMTSPRTHLRETTKDIVTAVTHHDINGMNTVSTVALKDIDVQMSQLSGYETYV